MERTVSLERLLAERPRWVRFAQRDLGSAADAEEVFDATLARLSAAELPPEVELDRWFGRVLRNATVDWVRRRAAEQRALDGFAREADSHVPTPADAKRVCTCAQQVADRLKPSYAEVIDAVHFQEVPLAEFAQSSRLTVNNATVRLHRARRALRVLLEERCGVCSNDGCSDCDCAPPGPAL